LATPAGDNEGQLALQLLSEVPPHFQPLALERLARLEFVLDPEARAAGWPRLSLIKVGEGPVEGALPYWWLGNRFVIEVNPERVLPGEYRLWLMLSPGRVVLMWFVVGQ